MDTDDGGDEDNDGDGIPDNEDIDNDNDGVADDLEIMGGGPFSCGQSDGLPMDPFMLCLMLGLFAWRKRRCLPK